MQRPLRTILVCLASLLAIVACSEDKNPNPVGTGGTGGGSGDAGASYANNGEGVCPGTTRPANDEFCQNTCLHDAAATCSNSSGRPIDSCCVLVGEPGKAQTARYLERTTDTKEYADPTGADPNLDCFEPATYPPAPPAGGDQKTASLKGVLKAFANGGCLESDLLGVTMEVYKVQRTGDPATDGALGELVGSALVVDASMPIVMEQVTNCNDDPRPNREYEYPNVPMYTELLIKTYGDGWQPLYTYNVYISENDPDFDAASNSYTYDVRALAADDFNTIPTVAIGQTITPGNGAIGGEVHDCDNIRLQNARVDISLPRKGLVYFNSDEDDPLPEQSRQNIGTGRTALYSALDIKVDGATGTFARVAGTGVIPDGNGGDKLVSLGYYDVRVFPNSISAVSLRGLRPFQVP